MRLSAGAKIAGGVRLPRYDPAAHGAGIVHLGIGAFHRAHQAVYTDDALAAEGGDWRITGVSLRGTGAADALNPQDGRYTLLERGSEGVSARILGSIDRVIAATRAPGAALATLADPATRIVSLTVTEKAYGIDRKGGGIDRAHPAIAADLAAPRDPGGAIGLIVEALRLRHAAGVAAFDVLCCDNLPENGAMLRGGVIGYARALDPDLAGRIAGEVGFPATMVDRITPAANGATLADAARLTGCDDHAAIETEPFSQWVIEDGFRGPRPAWEAGGALMVADVAPYERMKLRMLNGAHSMIAYAGYLSGCEHVRDAMVRPDLAALVRRHLGAASATLDPLPGMDFARYARDLEARFANPALAHATYQIAMDGTEKLPQRLLEPAVATLEQGGDPRPFAFAVAAWMRYCLGPHTLRDPREQAIGRAVKGANGAEDIAAALHALPGLFPARLREEARWREPVVEALRAMLDGGVDRAIAEEARR